MRGFTRAQLTPTEFRIFRDLAANEGATVSVSRLLEVGWPDKGERGATCIGALKTHVAHLRRKLREIGGQPRRINAINGQGYVLSLNRNAR